MLSIIHANLCNQYHLLVHKEKVDLFLIQELIGKNMQLHLKCKNWKRRLKVGLTLERLSPMVDWV